MAEGTISTGGSASGGNIGQLQESLLKAQTAEANASRIASNVNTATSIVNSVAGVVNAVSAEKQRRAQEKANATSYRQQAAIYSQQADQYLQAAKLSASSARTQADIAESNAKNERLRASYIQQYEDFNLSASRSQAQQRIGQGKVSFAANGILLESRAGAATSIWEADEEADAAVQRLNIMQQAEDEAYGYLSNAQSHLVSGYSNASSMFAEAASQAGQGVSAAQQAGFSLQNAIAAEKAAKKKKWGGIVAAVGASVGTILACTGVGAPIGALVAASSMAVGAAIDS